MAKSTKTSSVHSLVNKAMASNLKRQRQEAGLTMRDVSDTLGVPHSFVGKIETCERRLSMSELLEYCHGLNFNLDEVISAGKSALLSKERPKQPMLTTAGSPPIH